MATGSVEQSTAVLKKIERRAFQCDWSSESHGIVDSGLSVDNNIILSAYTITQSNNFIRVSNIRGGNYTFQCVNVATNEIIKTGSSYVFAYVLPVQYITI